MRYVCIYPQENDCRLLNSDGHLDYPPGTITPS